MPISEDELKELIEVNADLDKLSTISSDGKRLLTRIPKEIVEELEIKKGNKFRWLVKTKDKKIDLNLEK